MKDYLLPSCIPTRETLHGSYYKTNLRQYYIDLNRDYAQS